MNTQPQVDLESLTASPIRKLIFDHYKKVGDSEPQRGYLGASEIGCSCERFLWYRFRQACTPNIDGRTYRLFDTGNHEEARFVKDLRDIGVTVHDVDSNGNQFEVEEFGGHFSGHMDSALLGVPEAPKTWHVGEFKTHNTKSFAKLIKGGKIDGIDTPGVAGAKPQHYAQMQTYMGISGMTRALYLAKNKDNDDLYAERVRFDRLYFQSLMERAKRVIFNTEPPERIATREDFFECQWCDAHAICWGTPDLPAFPVPAVSCRQCCHATPTLDGNAHWVCSKFNRGLSPQDQDRACDDHLCLPGMFADATPIDYSENHIIYENTDGTRWLQGNADGCYKTKELLKLPRKSISGDLIQLAKEKFGAVVTDVSSDNTPF